MEKHKKTTVCFTVIFLTLLVFSLLSCKAVPLPVLLQIAFDPDQLFVSNQENFDIVINCDQVLDCIEYRKDFGEYQEAFLEIHQRDTYTFTIELWPGYNYLQIRGIRGEDVSNELSCSISFDAGLFPPMEYVGVLGQQEITAPFDIVFSEAEQTVFVLSLSPETDWNSEREYATAVALYQTSCSTNTKQIKDDLVGSLSVLPGQDGGAILLDATQTAELVRYFQSRHYNSNGETTGEGTPITSSVGEPVNGQSGVAYYLANPSESLLQMLVKKPERGTPAIETVKLNEGGDVTEISVPLSTLAFEYNSQLTSTTYDQILCLTNEALGVLQQNATITPIATLPLTITAGAIKAKTVYFAGKTIYAVYCVYGCFVFDEDGTLLYHIDFKPLPVNQRNGVDNETTYDLAIDDDGYFYLIRNDQPGIQCWRPVS
jgi:hypothetical protein